MDVSKFKPIGVEGVKSSLQDCLNDTTIIGASTTKPLLQNIKDVSDSCLKDLQKSGVISDFDVGKVQTRHQAKGRWGRFKDFLCWKTPVKRFYYKPSYVQVRLEDVLWRMHEHTDFFGDRTGDEVLETISSVGSLMIWEERYPEDPYSIVETNIALQPVVPVNQITLQVEVSDGGKTET